MLGLLTSKPSIRVNRNKSVSMDDSKSSGKRIFHTGPDGKTRIEDVTKADHSKNAPLQEMSFATHVLSLNAMALMHLGEVDGMTEDERDFTAARHVIDTLVMLEEKTKGNLTDDESGLLTAILYDLRVKCVRT